ncbi:MAG: hypothetical protein COA78_19980 [Blastopirellula sp.]|nr:MAG: hypothetical protein COA78_19980 [Blastopirellula sp.]
MLKLIMVLGAILGMSAVIAGAMGKHLLENKLSEEHANRLIQSYPAADGAEETSADESDGESEEADTEGTEAEEAEEAEEAGTEEAGTEEAGTDAVQTDIDGNVIDPASDDASELGTAASAATATVNASFSAEKNSRLTKYLIAAKYQMYNAFGILFVTLLASVSTRGKGTAVLSGLSFIIGTVMFCGPMYAESYNPEINQYGLLIPIGGIVILLGWGMLLLATVQFKFDKEESA